MPTGIGAAGSGGTTEVTPQLQEVIGQVQQQTGKFGNLLTDPGFTGQSEMALMLQLQRAMGLETMMYTSVSNMEKARTDASKQAINNFK